MNVVVGTHGDSFSIQLSDFVHKTAFWQRDFPLRPNIEKRLPSKSELLDRTSFFERRNQPQAGELAGGPGSCRVRGGKTVAFGSHGDPATSVLISAARQGTTHARGPNALQVSHSIFGEQARRGCHGLRGGNEVAPVLRRVRRPPPN